MQYLAVCQGLEDGAHWSVHTCVSLSAEPLVLTHPTFSLGPHLLLSIPHDLFYLDSLPHSPAKPKASGALEL